MSNKFYNMDFFEEIPTYQNWFDKYSLHKMCKFNLDDYTKLSLLLLDKEDIDYMRPYNDMNFSIGFRQRYVIQSDLMEGELPIDNLNTFDVVSSPGFDGSTISSTTLQVRFVPYPINFRESGPFLYTQGEPVYQLSSSFGIISHNGRNYKKIERSHVNVEYRLNIEKNTDEYFFVRISINKFDYDYINDYNEKYYICDQIDGLVEFLEYLLIRTK